MAKSAPFESAPVFATCLIVLTLLLGEEAAYADEKAAQGAPSSVRPKEKAWLLVQKSQFEEQVFKIELYLQADRIRVNMSGEPSPTDGTLRVDKTEIWNLREGRISNVDHVRKTAYFTPLTEDRDQIIGEFGGRNEGLSLRPLGTKRKVSTYACSEYEVVVSGEAFGKVCYSKDLPKPLLKLYRAVGERIEKARGPSVITQVDLRTEGFLMSYVDEENAVTEITSIQEIPIGTEIFEVPPDYRDTSAERSRPVPPSPEEEGLPAGE
ncbi:MAG: DUF4412 domain-containing protein [Nitrospirae bacterium]|nr:DUF4412 domain-containing protein [Nitrospirota bacterium]